MTRNIRIQVFLDTKMYADMANLARDKKILYKNDSELCRKMLFDYINLIESVELSMYTMKQQLSRIKEEKSQLQAVVEGLRDIKRRDQQDKEIKAYNKKLNKKAKK